MLIKTLTVGMLETNCYIVTDEETRKCAIIDPGAESNTILDYIESNGLAPEAIFLTHGHFDHCTALEAVACATGAPAYIHEGDINAGKLRRLRNTGGDGSGNGDGDGNLNRYAEGDVFSIGGLEFTILETPGHSPGSVTLKCETALFTGDTLFRDSCGRTDLEGGDAKELMKSLKRLAGLDGDYEVYPGHAGTTTLSRERSFNYYIEQAL